MTYQQFIRLDQLLQIETTVRDGIVISKRIEHDDLLMLYQLDDFYVELSYLEDLSEIYRIRHGEDERLLEPYLELIDISELL